MGTMWSLLTLVYGEVVGINHSYLVGWPSKWSICLPNQPIYAFMHLFWIRSCRTSMALRQKRAGLYEAWLVFVVAPDRHIMAYYTVSLTVILDSSGQVRGIASKQEHTHQAAFYPRLSDWHSKLLIPNTNYWLQFGKVC